MKLTIHTINFFGKPDNYSIVDNYVSRSAQPLKEDFLWLKEQGVTDVFNFRTMMKQAVNFDEKKEVEKAGMKYHAIPSITASPDEKNVDMFLKEVNEIKKRGGKAHIHCMAGADRTGMYTFIYKMKNGEGSIGENIIEWFEHNFHYKKYPYLIDWAFNYLKTKVKQKVPV